MTIQDLDELKVSRKKMRLLELEIKQLEDLVTSVNPYYSDMPKGQSERDKMCNCIAQIVDFKKQLAAEIEYMVFKQKFVHNEINKIDNTNYRLILSYRYVLGYKWEDISAEMNYSMRHIRRLHDEAIKMSCFVSNKVL